MRGAKQCFSILDVSRRRRTRTRRRRRGVSLLGLLIPPALPVRELNASKQENGPGGLLLVPRSGLLVFVRPARGRSGTGRSSFLGSVNCQTRNRNSICLQQCRQRANRAKRVP